MSTSSCVPTSAVSAMTSRAIGTGLTSSVADPETVPLVAVMEAEPLANAVATPSESTEATPPFDVAQVHVNPVIGLPKASVPAAVNTKVSPRAGSVFCPGVTSIRPSACATVTVTALLWTPTAVAVTEVVPSATAVTLPAASTVATVGSDESQLKTEVVRAVPPAFRATAESWTDSPNEARDLVPGVTAMDATVVSGAMAWSELQPSTKTVARPTAPAARRTTDRGFVSYTVATTFEGVAALELTLKLRALLTFKQMWLPGTRHALLFLLRWCQLLRLGRPAALRASL